MKYAIMVLALVGVLARPTAAIAAGVTGNKMLELCTRTGDVGVALCAGYAWGWRIGHTVAILATGKYWIKIKDPHAIMRAVPTNICIPQEVENPQLGEVLVKYLQDHPEKRHQEVDGLSLHAFAKAFPCR